MRGVCTENKISALKNSLENIGDNIIEIKIFRSQSKILYCITLSVVKNRKIFCKSYVTMQQRGRP